MVAGDLQAGEIPTFIYDGTDYIVTTAAAGGGRLLAYQVFTSSGNWNRPTGCTAVKVTVTGGGGGAWNSGALSTASTGGTTSFGGFCSASGGSGGSNSSIGTNAGQGSGGNLTLRGGPAIRYDELNAQTSTGGMSYFAPLARAADSSFYYGKGGDGLQSGAGGGTAIEFISSGIPSSVFVTIGGGGTGRNGGQSGNGGVAIVEAYS